MPSTENPQQPWLQFFGPSSTTPSSLKLPFGSSSSAPDEAIITVFDPRANQHTPIFAVQSSAKTKPHVHLFRLVSGGGGDDDDNGSAAAATRQLIGHATFSSSRGTIDVSLRGRDVQLKMDLSGSGSKAFQLPPWGKLKWKMNGSGTGYKLVDEQKRVVASYDKLSSSSSSSSSGAAAAAAAAAGIVGGGKHLQIFEQGDDFFVELVVLTGVAEMKMDDKEGKEAFKFIRHIAGLP